MKAVQRKEGRVRWDGFMNQVGFKPLVKDDESGE